MLAGIAHASVSAFRVGALLVVAQVGQSPSHTCQTKENPICKGQVSVFHALASAQYMTAITLERGVPDK
jgi:hypothetical protein